MSPCRSSIDLLHGVSTDASPLAVSAASPSKLKKRHSDVKISMNTYVQNPLQLIAQFKKKKGRKRDSRNSILCKG